MYLNIIWLSGKLMAPEKTDSQLASKD